MQLGTAAALGCGNATEGQNGVEVPGYCSRVGGLWYLLSIVIGGAEKQY